MCCRCEDTWGNTVTQKLVLNGDQTLCEGNKQTSLASLLSLSLAQLGFKIVTWRANFSMLVLVCQVPMAFSSGILFVCLLVQLSAFYSPGRVLGPWASRASFHTEPEIADWRKAAFEATGAWRGAVLHILPIRWKSLITFSIPLLMNRQIIRAPARKFIKTSQDFKVWTKRRNGWLGPWQAQVRTSFPGWSLFLKLDYKGNEEECWGRSFWNASQFSPFLGFTVSVQAPQHSSEEVPAKKSINREEENWKKTQ